MHATLPLLEHSDFPVIYRKALETLQVNLGYRCNQSCLHCHVNAGPKRTEMMTDTTLAAVMYNLISDIVGGIEVVVLEETLNAPQVPQQGVRIPRSWQTTTPPPPTALPENHVDLPTEEVSLAEEPIEVSEARS